MEKTTNETATQHATKARSEKNESVARLNATIDNLKNDLSALEEILNQKLQRKETDIDGICQQIVRMEDKIREANYRLSLENPSDSVAAPRKKAMNLYGQGYMSIRPPKGKLRKPIAE